MKLLRLNEETYINLEHVRSIFLTIEPHENCFFHVINIKTESIFPYRKYSTREKALYELRALVDFIADGGTNLEDYRALTEFEQGIWDAYRNSGADYISLRVARYMLLESDPCPLLIMTPANIARMMRGDGMCNREWFIIDKIREFKTFLNLNKETHPEWFLE